MDVTSAQSATVSSATNKSATTASDGAATNALTGDFNTFIQLLTAQMNNQDPLEPTTNTEFVAQLASFSAVEQQVLTNEKLASIAEGLGLSQASEAATWIGKEVLTEGGYANYTGEPVEIEVDTVEAAEGATLIVRDQSGAIVTRATADKSATTLTWDGTGKNGNPASSGLYTFSVESSAADGTVIGTQKGKVFSAIEEVRLTESGNSLITSGGITLSTDDVTAIR